MVAGSRPFRGQSNVETMHAILRDPAPPLAGQPPELQDILDRALAKDPRDRYQHAGDLMLDLRRFQRAWESKTLRSQRGDPAAASRRGVAGWALGVAVVLIAAGAWWVGRRGGPAPEANPLADALFTRFTDFPGEENDPSISPDGKFVAFRADRDGRTDILLSQVGTGRFTNLTKDQKEDLPVAGIRSQGFSFDGSEIWLAGYKPSQRLRLLPLTGGASRAFLRDGAVNVSWSPDGSRMVYHTYDDGDPMFVVDRNGANQQRIFTLGAGGHNHYPTWSPDGRWIYFVSGPWDARDMDLWRIAPSGGNPQRLTRHNSDVRSVAPLASGAVLYIAPEQDGSGPWLWALDADRKVTRRISFGLEHYTAVSASADGRRLVAAVSNATASLWAVPILDRVAGEGDIKPYPLPNARALAPRFASNSLFYLSSRGTGDGLWRFQDGQAFEVWKGTEGPLLSPPAISADGRRAAIVLRKQGKLRLHVISADGAEFQPLTDAIDVRGAACWSPDGKWIVAGGNDAAGEGLFKIPVQGGAPVRILAKGAFNPVWSPDGRLIVYTGTTVGNSSPLLAIGADGGAIPLPAITIGKGNGANTPRHRFLPDGTGVVYLPGSEPGEDFWLLDLRSMKTRPLAQLGNADTMAFDITPDGKQIVFDRLRENSDVVLIDLPK
jgi:Tol biopolymer transport system component